jgi:hypothetical protein
MDVDDPPNHIQLSSAKAVIVGESERLEPEFARVVFAFHVNVRRLLTVETHEENPMGARDTFDSWHWEALPPEECGTSGSNLF